MKRPVRRACQARASAPHRADFDLRNAEAADLEFIWHLRVETMKTIVSEAYGWDEATQRQYAAESMAGTYWWEESLRGPHDG